MLQMKIDVLLFALFLFYIHNTLKSYSYFKILLRVSIASPRGGVTPAQSGSSCVLPTSLLDLGDGVGGEGVGRGQQVGLHAVTTVVGDEGHVGGRAIGEGEAEHKSNTRLSKMNIRYMEIVDKCFIWTHLCLI